MIGRQPLCLSANAAFRQKGTALKKIIIAIDGHSSTGKSTLARALGEALGYKYISTGDMYRAVTLYFLRHGVPLDDPDAIRQALQHIRLEFETGPRGNRILMNGQDVQDEIRSMEVANMVSDVAAIPEVRREMVRQQRLIGKDKGVVMDGRDIGTVVFPEAELKIFLTASPEVRARRRYDELRAKGMDVTLDEVRRNIEARDRIDSTRQDSPLRMADDAVLIDNSNLTPEEQLARALALARERIEDC